VSQLFLNLKSHKQAWLFNQPLMANDPMFHKLKHDYNTLNMLELHFKIGVKFEDT